MNTNSREIGGAQPAPLVPRQSDPTTLAGSAAALPRGRAPAPQPVHRLQRLAIVGIFALSGAVAWTSPNPPDRMTYQGFLVDGNGVALGNTAPKNYDVIFRVFDDQNVGNLLWSEQQTITVDKGYFSVLLGEGAAVGSEPRPALPTLFAGSTASDRFVGITVKGIGNGGANVDILPRLRLITSPYAFLSQQALKMVQDTGADLITASGNSVVVNGTISASEFHGNGGTLDSLNAGTITTGTLSQDRLPSHLTGTRTFSGNVGIGTTSPNYLLSMGNGLGNTKIALWDGGPTSAYGLGIQGGQFRFHVDTAAARFSFFNAPAGTEIMTLLGGGRLGLGQPSPSGRFHVNSGDTLAGIFESSSTIGTWLSLGNSSVGGRYWQIISTGSGNGEGAGKMLIGNGIFPGTTSVGMTLVNNGRVGIGTTDPGSQLQVNGGIRARGGVPGGFGVNNNGYAFSGNGGDDDSGLFSTTDGRVSLYSNSQERLRVDGGLYFYYLGNIGDHRNMQYNDATGQIGWDNSSRRYKINIRPLEDDFSQLLKAQPMTYTRPESPDFWEIGFIAEDFHDLGLTRLVDYDKEGRPDGINYEKICLYLNENAKQQQKELTELKATCVTQAEEVASQRREIDDLKTRLASLEKVLRQAAVGAPGKPQAAVVNPTSTVASAE